MNSGASSKKKDEHRNQPDPAPDKGDVWIWRAIDVTSRLRIANHLSKTREKKDAIIFLWKVAKRLAHPRVLFTSDKLRAYAGALKEVFGVRVLTGGRPKKVYPEGLLYGQVDKERVKGHLKAVDRKAKVGTMADIEAVFKQDKLCEVINTSFIERDNLSVRQHNGRLVRRTLSHSKDWQMHQASVDFEDAVHNFVRPHLSLRLELPEPDGRRKWKQRTPAMAAGLTDHIWSIRELVTYRLTSRM